MLSGWAVLAQAGAQSGADLHEQSQQSPGFAGWGALALAAAQQDASRAVSGSPVQPADSAVLAELPEQPEQPEQQLPGQGRGVQLAPAAVVTCGCDCKL